ncbi:uncharacterized protein LOC127737421 [Mytilus californianus]|uniref:uncharacterized protein LOC127737421 n=1 Tax=Mytilus californianus TaxID=6549 RepID=UPI002247B9D9|nr:uncharacterized protein LOC127737421 [Mytilus californianus]
MDVAYVYVFLLTFFNVILEVSCQSAQEECPATYHQCTGGTWCCPEGLYCTGTSLCLSINGMIVLAILSSVGLGILLAAVCVVYSKCTEIKHKKIQVKPAKPHVTIPEKSGNHHSPPYYIV